MYTANDGKDPSCRLAKEQSSELLHRRRAIAFSVSLLGTRLPSLRAIYYRRQKRFYVKRLPSDGQGEDLSNGVSIVVIALVVVEILFFECEGQL